MSDLAAPNMIAYCTSKAAIDSLTKCLAIDLGPHQVRVNGIRPGVVVTNIFGSQRGEEIPRSFMEKLTPFHVLSRVSEPSEVAEVMAFMASDKCNFMTGTNLLFDGGYNILRADVINATKNK